ncbi:MAG: tRNA lysidine(34) synthetase TilS [Deltaproteobacteria bacterium]|nr:tRNA lysidine(34) synthetase TilS [Deltaproteobacteria bacterium]
MLNQIRKTIETHSMLEQGDHLVVAVSGGPDSVALLRALALLTDEFRLRLTTAHLNHGLREEEADEEEAFVRRLSDGMGIACICKKTDIRALKEGKRRSLEEIGREERYRFLQETAEKCGAVKIAVGHHRDDQAETVLLHLLRGSGPEGLRGILPVLDGRIIRPLLDVGRADILAFLRREGLTYRSDSSNESPLFLRNRIRNELIPGLAAHCNPRLIEGLCQTAGIIRREDDYLRGVVRQIIRRFGIDPGSEEVALPVADFLVLHEAIQGRIIKCLLEGAAPLRNGIGYRHIEAVLVLARRSVGRFISLDLPFGIRVERKGGILRIRKEGERRARKNDGKKKNPLRFEYRVDIPATIHLSEIDRTIRLEWIEKPQIREMKDRPETAFMDYECMTLPLILRNMRPGDRVAPLGTGGTKKLKDYFIDRKIAATCRGEIPLLVDAGSIIWIAGERISERVRVTEKTRKVLKAEIVVSGKPSEII